MAETKLTTFQQEQMKAIEKIMNYKLICEANIVASVYKEPDSIFNYDLRLSDFHNNAWRVFFVILEDLIVKEKKVPDDITIGFYLEKHDKLRKEFDKFGGISVLIGASENVKVENLDGYVQELRKWRAVLGLIKEGFPVGDKIKEFVDMDAESILSEYEARLMHNFLSVETGIKSYNLMAGSHDLLKRINEGKNVGLPLYNAKLLNKVIGGNLIGNVTMCGALSGCGKTTFAINLILPQIISQNEQIVVFLNEQTEEDWGKELILWVANNIFKGDIDKIKLRDGNIDKESLELLEKACDWIEEKKDEQYITIIPLERYRCKDVIKLIKKYSAMNVKYFILDTFKPSSDDKSDEYWKSMMKDSVLIYDTVKPKVKNVHIWITYQLEKSATKARFLSTANLSLSKNTVDVATTNLMFRVPFADEIEGEKREIVYFCKIGNSTIKKKLKKDESYIIIFVPKNRFGQTNIQIVAKFDLGKNKYEECGFCHIMPDF